MSNVEELVNQLKDTALSSYKKRQVLEDLADLAKKDTDAQDAILSLSRDEDLSMRRKYLSLIGKLPQSDKLCDVLISYLMQEKDDYILKDIINFLAAFNNEKVIEVITPFTKDDSYSVSHTANKVLKAFVEKQKRVTATELKADDEKVPKSLIADFEEVEEIKDENKEEPEQVKAVPPKPQAKKIEEKKPRPQKKEFTQTREHVKQTKSGFGKIIFAAALVFIVIFIFVLPSSEKVSVETVTYQEPKKVEVVKESVPKEIQTGTIVKKIPEVTQKELVWKDDSPLGKLTLNLVSGSEKKELLNWAVSEFNKTETGKNIKINLSFSGSREAIQKIKDSSQNLHIYIPASSLQVNELGTELIRSRYNTFSSPMVFFFWKERYELLKNKYGSITSMNLLEALKEKNWKDLGGSNEWGHLKFSFANAMTSNSGLFAWILLTQDFFINKPISTNLLEDPAYINFIKEFKAYMAASSNSSSKMVRQMILKGPSSYDGLLIYESLAKTYLNSPSRWGELVIIQPSSKLITDHPAVILRNKWTSPNHVRAAEAFIAFLLSAPIQQKGTEFGFNPAIKNNSLPALKTVNSLLEKL